MGRGADNLDSGDVNATRTPRRSMQEGPPRFLSLLDLNKELSQGAIAGETMILANGEIMIIDKDDPVALMHGLNAVLAVTKRDDGRFIIEFSDGEQALVDLEEGSARLMFSEYDPEKTAAALYAALGAGYMDLADLSPAAEEKLNKYLASKALYGDLPNAENFKNYAKSLDDLGDILLSDQIHLNPESLSFAEDEARDPSLEQVTYSRQRSEVLAALRAAGISRQDIHNLPLFGSDAEGNAYGIDPSKIEEREKAANKLSVEIPNPKFVALEVQDVDENNQPLFDKDGNPVMTMHQEGDDGVQRFVCDEENSRYIMGKQELDTMDRVLMMTAAGQRFYTHRGPPGCGKDTFWKEFAAWTNRPYELLSFGPSAKIEEAIGGSDFQSVTLKEERLVPVLDEDGFEIIEDGKRKMETKLFDVAAGMVLTEKVARLGQLLQEPTMVVITEPEGSFQTDIVRLNAALGDDYGVPTGRVFYVNSTEGETHPVHPDCVIAITHNMDTPEGDEMRGRESTHDRAENIEWGERPVEEDAKILAGMARNSTRRLAYENGRGEEMPALMPAMADVDVSETDLMPIARLMQVVRNDMTEGRGDFVSGMEMRRAIMFWDRYRMNAYMRGPEFAEAEAHKSLLQLLDGVEMTHRERVDILESHLRDTLAALKPQGIRYFNAAKEYAKKHGEEVNLASGL